MAAYAYFDQNGNLLEFISDKSLRQGNENAGNQILVFMEPEDFNYEGKSLSCAYKDKNLDTIITDVIDVVQNIDTQVVPTFKDYDPTHFVSGKSYPFIVVDVPNLVLEDEGSKILSLALIELNDQNQEVSRMSYNSVITFYVDESVIQFTQTITKSEFDYLLAKIGEIAGEVIEVSHIIYKVNSKSDLGNYTQYELNRCFFVLSHSDYSNHPVLLKRGASRFELLFDLANYYTKSEIDSIRETLQNNINLKSTVVGEADANNAWRYLTIDGVRKVIGGSGGGGGGAIYTAGYGISIIGPIISIDDTVVETKQDAAATYETITHASTTYATKTELETVKKNAFIKVNTTTYPTLASFLLSTGEEGYIYLYPIDTTDLTKGYYQYIWEDNAWLGIGSTRIDLSNYVDLDSAQTITGVKTFTDVIKVGASPNQAILNIDQNNLQIRTDNGDIALRPSTKVVRAWTDNEYDLGKSSHKWKDFYLSGKIKDGTNEFNADNVFNVINASDIVDNTLTEDQLTIITNGKITQIKGNLLGLKDSVIDSSLDISGSNYYGFIRGTDITSSDRNYVLQRFQINVSTRVISLDAQSKILFGNTATTIQRAWTIYVRNLNGVDGQLNINAKTFPNYPISNSYEQFLSIAPNGGSLSWKDIVPTNAYATNSTTVLEYETINNISISADTTYTLAIAPNNTYPEYKGYITNSDASNSVTITLTGISKIKCNNGNIVVVEATNSTVTIPASKTLEFKIQNGKATFFDWDAPWADAETIKTQSTGGATSIQLKTWVGTQAQYDSILTKDANTQYIII